MGLSIRKFVSRKDMTVRPCLYLALAGKAISQIRSVVRNQTCATLEIFGLSESNVNSTCTATCIHFWRIVRSEADRL